MAYMSQLRSRQKQLNNQASGEKLAGESFNIILNTSVLFSLSQTSAFFYFFRLFLFTESLVKTMS